MLIGLGNAPRLPRLVGSAVPRALTQLSNRHTSTASPARDPRGHGPPTHNLPSSTHSLPRGCPPYLGHVTDGDPRTQRHQVEAVHLIPDAGGQRAVPAPEIRHDKRRWPGAGIAGSEWPGPAPYPSHLAHRSLGHPPAPPLTSVLVMPLTLPLTAPLVILWPPTPAHRLPRSMLPLRPHPPAHRRRR